MNILLINTYSSGGAASACIRLHKGLLAAGYSSKLLFLHQTNFDIEEAYSFYDNYFTIKKSCIKINTILNNFKNEQKTKGLPKGYEGFRFPYSPYDITSHSLYNWADIINLHWVADFLDWKSFFKKTTKPIVWTLHDMLPFTGGFHYEKGFPFKEYRRLINHNLKIKNSALIHPNLTIVSPSLWLKKKSIKSYLFSPYFHIKIFNGLNTDIFKTYDKEVARRIFDIPIHSKIILFVADYVTNYRKGINLLLESLPLLKEKVHLVIIGSQSHQFKKQTQTHCLGKIQDDRLMALAYNTADVFVIPSIEDNLPNTVIESLCCGTPVVGFNVGGISEIITPTQNGLLCENISAKALAESINNALNLSFDNKRIREDGINLFNQKLQVKKYTNLYKTILNSHITHG
jgi:glycosyltransferase involved in cell wall biosynthesis